MPLNAPNRQPTAPRSGIRVKYGTQLLYTEHTNCMQVCSARSEIPPGRRTKRSFSAERRMHARRKQPERVARRLYNQPAIYCE